MHIILGYSNCSDYSHPSVQHEIGYNYKEYCHDRLNPEGSGTTRSFILNEDQVLNEVKIVKYLGHVIRNDLGDDAGVQC